MSKNNTITNIIKWNAKRGMLETEVLINSFIKNNNFSQLKLKEKILFLEMLQYDDPLLIQWILEAKNTAPQKFKKIIKKLENLIN